MDDLCERLEGLSQTLSDCIANSQRDKFVNSTEISGRFALPPNVSIADTLDTNTAPSISPYMVEDPKINLHHGVEAPNKAQNIGASPSYRAPSDPVGHMVADSYGRLR